MATAAVIADPAIPAAPAWRRDTAGAARKWSSRGAAPDGDAVRVVGRVLVVIRLCRCLRTRRHGLPRLRGGTDSAEPVFGEGRMNGCVPFTSWPMPGHRPGGRAGRAGPPLRGAGLPRAGDPGPPDGSAVADGRR